MSLLAVENLTVAFPGHVAVREVSFAIEPGETLALVGESGCGKSVTAFSMMRLLPPNARVVTGRILLDGADLMAASPAEMREVRGKKISLIQQEPMTSLNPVLSIGTQIGEVIRRHEKVSRRTARARCIELLDLVSIPDAHRRIDDYPHNLSGGMRQRVMIAMAVACGPKLLIADEPTTALDVTTQAQVLDLLDDLRRRLSMAVLLITHDLGVVAQWADRINVMYAGRIVEQAAIRPFFAQPMHPYSRGLLGARVDVDADEHYSASRLSEIPGSVGSAAGEAGCPFAPRCPMVETSCRVVPPSLLAFEAGRRVACPVSLQAVTLEAARHG
ncbi:MAG: ABC transporter ATP-binding protein [Reyranella sp.]|nr:ABC transporter ATP-binding protein [Reyranella sp.]MBL6650651.1 ABC transporter ATP-binding protein [Reyranella sp.]